MDEIEIDHNRQQTGDHNQSADNIDDVPFQLALCGMRDFPGEKEYRECRQYKKKHGGAEEMNLSDRVEGLNGRCGKPGYAQGEKSCNIGCPVFIAVIALVEEEEEGNGAYRSDEDIAHAGIVVLTYRCPDDVAFEEQEHAQDENEGEQNADPAQGVAKGQVGVGEVGVGDFELHPLKIQGIRETKFNIQYSIFKIH